MTGATPILSLVDEPLRVFDTHTDSKGLTGEGDAAATQ
jgi:hypothetical protein